MNEKSVTLSIEDDEVEQINKILLDEIEDITNSLDIDKNEREVMLGYYQGLYNGLNNRRFEPLSSQELYTIRALANEEISFLCELLKSGTVSGTILDQALPLLRSVVKKISVFFDESNIKIISN